MDNIILFTVIEGDRNNINNNNNVINTPRMYEQEAIKCFTEWRKNAGWLKDIKIICYCPTNNKPSKETITSLEELNVDYIETYLQESEKMEFGFFLVPLVGNLIEDAYPNSTLIHIDLDMNIIKPIPKEYFDGSTYIGQYDDNSALTQRQSNGWSNPLDTGFTISHTNSKFYKVFWDEFKELYFTKNYEHEQDWLNQNSPNGVCFLEEYVADKLFNKQIIDIKTIQFYQVGEGYAKVNELTDEQLDSVLFWHEHLFIDKESSYNVDRFKQKIEFMKRIKNGTSIRK